MTSGVAARSLVCQKCEWRPKQSTLTCGHHFCYACLTEMVDEDDDVICIMCAGQLILQALAERSGSSNNYSRSGLFSDASGTTSTNMDARAITITQGQGGPPVGLGFVVHGGGSSVHRETGLFRPTVETTEQVETSSRVMMVPDGDGGMTMAVGVEVEVTRRREVQDDGCIIL